MIKNLNEHKKEQNMEANVEIHPKSGSDPELIVVRNAGGFSVAKTFDCGQCFRFEPVKDTRHDSEFCGVAFGRFFSVANSGDDLLIYGCDEKFFFDRLYRFLSLDTDYSAINSDILTHCDSDYMKRAVERGNGIRILEQDAWEALCSFIISQNNNIPRIKKLVTALSERCGEPIDTTGMEEHGGEGIVYAFPSAEKIAALGEAALRELKVGFRAAYIADAAEKVSSGTLDTDRVSQLGTDECISELCSIHGVGVKVASCTALFGMRKYDAFPIDVWIRRVISEHFEPNFDVSSLGKFRGIAQQYMFYAARFDTQ